MEAGTTTALIGRYPQGKPGMPADFVLLPHTRKWNFGHALLLLAESMVGQATSGWSRRNSLEPMDSP